MGYFAAALHLLGRPAYLLINGYTERSFCSTCQFRWQQFWRTIHVFVIVGNIKFRINKVLLTLLRLGSATLYRNVQNVIFRLILYMKSLKSITIWPLIIYFGKILENHKKIGNSFFVEKVLSRPESSAARRCHILCICRATSVEFSL